MPGRPGALTRGDPGEHDAAFTPDGDLLFLSARPAPGDDATTTRRAALWCLPARGGEARPAGTRPGGLAGRSSPATRAPSSARSATLPGAAHRRRRRGPAGRPKDAKVTAILHEGAPVRFWDHDLGPDRPRLLAASAEPAPTSR